jgi:hypothetical protein
LTCLQPCSAGIIKILRVAAHKRFLAGSSLRTQRHSHILAQPKGLDMLKIIVKLLEKASKLIVTLENNKFGSLVFVTVVGFFALINSKGFN